MVLLSERNKRNIGLATGAVGALALLLFPASIITLGIGAALGYRGRTWVEQIERSVEQ